MRTQPHLLVQPGEDALRVPESTELGSHKPFGKGYLNDSCSQKPSRQTTNCKPSAENGTDE